MKTYRELITSSELALGTFLFEFSSPGIGQILKHAQAEFVFLDMEHSGFSYETVKSILRNLHDAGIASLVRPPSAEYHDISRVLDMGAQGVVPPMMTAERAKKIAKYVKYPPKGVRGAIFAGAHDNYEGGDPSEKIATANANTCFIAQIETKQGVEDLEELGDMDAVDGFWLGHFDLSCDLGVPGQFEHPIFLDAVKRIRTIAEKCNKPLGRLVGSVEEGVALHQDGFRFLLYSGDAWLLQSKLAEGISSIREQVAS